MKKMNVNDSCSVYPTDEGLRILEKWWGGEEPPGLKTIIRPDHGVCRRWDTQWHALMNAFGPHMVMSHGPLFDCNEIHLETPDDKESEPSGERETVRCEVSEAQGYWQAVLSGVEEGEYIEAPVSSINRKDFAYIEDQHGNRWRGMPGWCFNSNQTICSHALGEHNDPNNWHPAEPVAVHFWKTKEENK